MVVNIYLQKGWKYASVHSKDEKKLEIKTIFFMNEKASLKLAIVFVLKYITKTIGPNYKSLII